MPRKGHSTGPNGCPSELAHYEARYGIRLRADKLTKQHRELARNDPAVARHLQRRIREAARFEALLEGKNRYTSDRPCPCCGSTTRTVYGAACYDCALRRRPLHTNAKGHPIWPVALRSRDGWLALCDAKQRERRGELASHSFGPFHASTTPTGTLSVVAPSLGLSIPDLAKHPYAFINNIVQRYPEFLELLRWAGWM